MRPKRGLQPPTLVLQRPALHSEDNGANHLKSLSSRSSTETAREAEHARPHTRNVSAQRLLFASLGDPLKRRLDSRRQPTVRLGVPCARAPETTLSEPEECSHSSKPARSRALELKRQRAKNQDAWGQQAAREKRVCGLDNMSASRIRARRTGRPSHLGCPAQGPKASWLRSDSRTLRRAKCFTGSVSGVASRASGTRLLQLCQGWAKALRGRAWNAGHGTSRQLVVAARQPVVTKIWWDSFQDDMFEPERIGPCNGEA